MRNDCLLGFLLFRLFQRYGGAAAATNHCQRYGTNTKENHRSANSAVAFFDVFSKATSSPIIVWRDLCLIFRKNERASQIETSFVKNLIVKHGNLHIDRLIIK